MTTAAEDVKFVFDKAIELLDKRESRYGSSWKGCGRKVCIHQMLNKSNYLRVSWERGLITDEQFMEDLLDQINWSAFAYYHMNEKVKEAQSVPIKQS